MNGYLVKFYKPFALRNALFYKHSIQILHIRQADKFIDGSIITNITIQIRIGFSPLFCRNSKHSHIQYVCLICVNNICLFLSNFIWNKIMLDSICMYTVIDF